MNKTLSPTFTEAMSNYLKHLSVNIHPHCKGTAQYFIYRNVAKVYYVKDPNGRKSQCIVSFINVRNGDIFKKETLDQRIGSIYNFQ